MRIIAFSLNERVKENTKSTQITRIRLKFTCKYGEGVKQNIRRLIFQSGVFCLPPSKVPNSSPLIKVGWDQIAPGRTDKTRIRSGWIDKTRINSWIALNSRLKIVMWYLWIKMWEREESGLSLHYFGFFLLHSCRLDFFFIVMHLNDFFKRLLFSYFIWLSPSEKSITPARLGFQDFYFQL